MTLGSLFDGSGTAPLCAAILGWQPVWASEIEAFPVAVTSKRFPHMAHLGDITKINGAMIEPVDVIVGGSPCQSLSIAGKRDGLQEGSYSHIFYEMIRVIKEMRAATSGQYPKWIVWENVPGALSSLKGEDFYSVLQAFCSCAVHPISIPRPEKNKRTGQLEWRTAGQIVADSFSIAWRIFNAQYWGVPQRRRRIFLAVDLTGDRAGKVLFDRQGIPWNFEQGIATPQRDTCPPLGSTDPNSGSFTGAGGVFSVKERAGKPGGGKGLLYGDDIAFTIATHPDAFVCYDNASLTKPLPVALTMQSFGEYKPLDVASRLKRRDYKDATDLVVSSPNDRDLSVRRLTPLECCRLQGFPDWWIGGCEEFPIGGWYAQHAHWRNAVDPCGAIPGSDTAAYKLWGNGMALPCLLYVLGGIA